MAEVITELEVRFTADTRPVEAAAKRVKGDAEKIEKKPVEQKIDGDAKDALAAMERVEAEGRKIVSAKTVATVDANIEKAETSLEKVQERLDYLRSVEATMSVTGDIKRAEEALKQITRRRDALVEARESMVIDADTTPAEAALDDVADDAAEAGSDGGDRAGTNLVAGIVAGLAAIPIAGAVAKIAETVAGAVVDGFNDGLAVEARQDRLQALTGITEQQAAFFARQAGEAYASNFGESIEANMDTARIAIQSGLLDPDATRRDSQKVISSLAGIADVLGEDIMPVSRAVTTLLRAGVVKSADEAFDLIATGAREGVNLHEDLLDTLTEYPALFSRLGLSGEEALGLINQGLEGGARNSDLAADALKEFQIRATDASDASAEGFKKLGLDAEEMTAKIAAGGEGAKEGLDQVLDGLRNMEDPVARNAAAVALFGTQAEDLGEALLSMDLTTAVDSLNGVTGAAQQMFETLASNDASAIETAQRNIEVAAEGMKGALAAAFSEPLGDLADWVSMNRGPIMEFFLDLAHGALDLGRSVVEGIASGTEAVGDFVGGPMADLVESFANVVDVLGALGPVMGFVLPDAQDFHDMADGMRGFDSSTEDAAQTMRDTLLPGIDAAQQRLDEFGIPIVQEAYLHDAVLRTASAIESVGVAADGTVLSLDGLDASSLAVSASGSSLEAQIVASAAALEDELAAAQAAGEGQEELTGRYNATRDALIEQVMAMGVAEDQAAALVDQVLMTPATASTAYSSNSEAEKSKVQALADRIETLPGSTTVIINADTAPAMASAGRLMEHLRNLRPIIQVGASVPVVRAGQIAVTQHDGHVVIPMGSGGLTPMANLAQKVPPNTWRIVGDRMDVPELYAPLDGSPRSAALIAEAIRLWPGGWPGMATGGIASARAGRTPSPTTTLDPRMATLIGAAVGDALEALLGPVIRDIAGVATGSTRMSRVGG